MKDGNSMSYGDIAFYISGSSRSILKAERLALNAMQRMSAIATKTHQFSSLLKDFKTQILDTRKTTPGFRAPEKQAVKIGGGENHRFALYDMIMLKDNHIDFAGGISEAIQKTLNYLNAQGLDLKIVVEARSLSEVVEILKNDGVNRILLDNFSFEETKKAVKFINGKCLTESSGGITLETVQQYAECGVDFISSGALIHSVHNLDLSLKAV
jgi:nicotinate-nucleotide pyrophosphorylase (carboxylating)